ncbi:hypothetical protein C1645_760189 [Glomus cerebriforme]|uniref:Serine-threonine/tyrosine-protein kinase catalytic domain-containing protein n=1 Tax=Glomus cerebriforme TaxID=658196 RepID=A0A397T969_9GLOM|nr:hypothetical protein C1645_760189 [Glomus cerebriforme]
MERCWNSDPSKRPTIVDLENIISQWLIYVNEYYKLNDENEEVIMEVSSNINNHFRSDMYEFVEANKALVQGQINTSII